MADTEVDFVNNKGGSGALAAALIKNRFDSGLFRPWEGIDGKSYVNKMNFNTGKVEVIRVANATGLLRKDDWKAMDESIVKIAKSRLKLVADIRGAGLQYTVAGGMAKTILETEVGSDINEATISLDGLRKSQNDRPAFDIRHLPLPIIHKDFFISARQLATSRQGGSPFDTTMAELSARRVAEIVERLATGTYGTYTYGGGTIYGLTNYPDRNTQVITAPDATGWTPLTLLNEVRAMKRKLQLDNMHGPFVLYHSLDWDTYLDQDYTVSTATPMTIRQRLLGVEGLQAIRNLDYLGRDGDFVLVMVCMTSDVIRMVIGQDFTTIQWETEGGMQLNFKVMCIIVPQIRSDMAAQCGIVHGAPA